MGLVANSWRTGCRPAPPAAGTAFRSTIRHAGRAACRRTTTHPLRLSPSSPAVQGLPPPLTRTNAESPFSWAKQARGMGEPQVDGPARKRNTGKGKGKGKGNKGKGGGGASKAAAPQMQKQGRQQKQRGAFQTGPSSDKADEEGPAVVEPSDSSAMGGKDPDVIASEILACGSARSALARCRGLWGSWHDSGFKPQRGVHPTEQQAAAALRGIADLSSSLSTPERLSLAREPCVRGLVRRILAAGRSNERLLSPKTATDAVWSMARLAGPDLFAEETEELLQCCAFEEWSLQPSETADLMWGLAMSRHVTPRLTEIAAAAARGGGLQEYSGRDFATTLWGFATLCCVPSCLLDGATAPQLDAASQGLDDAQGFTADQLTTSAWALAAMGEAQSPLMASLWSEMCQRGPAGLKGGGWKGRRSLVRAHQVGLSLQLEPGAAPPEELPKGHGRLLSAARQAWATDSSNLRTKRSSQIHREMSAALQHLGLRVLNEANVSGYSADMTLPELGIVLEADGLSHFARTTGQPLGSTALKRRHLELLGWRVVSVSLDQWELVIGPEERRCFLQEKIASVQ